MNAGEKDPRIDALLTELNSNRISIKNKLTDLESFNAQVQKVFPNTLDYRNKFLVDDKVKIVTGFYSTLLNYLQELNRSVREEIEIRRKIVTGDNEGKDHDVRELIKQLKKDGFIIPAEVKEPEPEQTKNGLTLIDSSDETKEEAANG